jgi:hypothetical protein
MELPDACAPRLNGSVFQQAAASLPPITPQFLPRAMGTLAAPPSAAVVTSCVAPIVSPSPSTAVVTSLAQVAPPIAPLAPMCVASTSVDAHYQVPENVFVSVLQGRGAQGMSRPLTTSHHGTTRTSSQLRPRRLRRGVGHSAASSNSSSSSRTSNGSGSTDAAPSSQQPHVQQGHQQGQQQQQHVHVVVNRARPVASSTPTKRLTQQAQRHRAVSSVAVLMPTESMPTLTSNSNLWTVDHLPTKDIRRCFAALNPFTKQLLDDASLAQQLMLPNGMSTEAFVLGYFFDRVVRKRSCMADIANSNSAAASPSDNE